MARYKLRQTRPLHLALVTALPFLMQMISSSHINTNMNIIMGELKITSQQSSWIINIETIVQLVFAPITGKLGEKFGASLIMSIGVFLIFFFNLLFASPTITASYPAVIVLRALAACGLGLAVPSSQPINFQLVVPGKIQMVIAIQSMMVPVGTITASLLAGIVASKAGWNWMCVGVAGMALINFVCIVWKLPFNLQKNKKSKIDVVGILMLGVGLVCLILGLLQISQKTSKPILISVGLIVFGILLMVGFVVYDQKWSRNKIFFAQMMNKSIVTAEVLLFLGSICAYAERYLIPFQLVRNFGLAPGKVGGVMAISGASIFVFSPITSILCKRVVARLSMRILYAAHGAIMLLDALQVLFFPRVGLYVLFIFIGMGVFCAAIIVLQSFNFTQCPVALASQMGVFNQLMMNLGNSIGVTLAVVIQQGIQNAEPGGVLYPPSSIGGTLFCLAGCCAACLAISWQLGVLPSERGKVGFTERLLSSTRGFEENLVHSGEMVEKDQFQGENQQSKLEKLVGLFQQPYVVYDERQFGAEEAEGIQLFRGNKQSGEVEDCLAMDEGSLGSDE